jgi:hypothetical protein
MIKELIDSIIKQQIKLYLNETTERVVRGGKIIKKLVHKPGYKIVDGKYEKMDSKEKRNRLKGAKKAAKRRKVHMSSIIKKRNKSLKKHTW